VFVGEPEVNITTGGIDIGRRIILKFILEGTFGGPE
jgi:hypothetical protein